MAREVQGIKLFGATIVLNMKGESDKSGDPTAEKRPEKIIPCPRCKSMETKFCYFNNYNVNQPRHFCKGCQRYWTAGGALRNVPVGAGRRKIKSPGTGPPGFPGNCLFDHPHHHPSGVLRPPFDLDGVTTLEALHLEAAAAVAAAAGGFQQDFPAKRRRSNEYSTNTGQTC
ncbi:hypothetical protein Nepgr_032212 [Nepenthes gracilis]|uniref:Dof-type domain-containing protein n=1 Tax=Nepenthes gracilis TaxID=150966 RepID=A0AAD3TJJ5_NEPGR|nr:hypothetical protein Nepgr_032212 [Nepenthes gracilis]